MEAVAVTLERPGQRHQPVHMIEANYSQVRDTILEKDGETAWQTMVVASNGHLSCLNP